MCIRDRIPSELKGADGVIGVDGKSAFEIWKEETNASSTATEADFITAITGAQGPAGDKGDKGDQGDTVQWITFTNVSQLNTFADDYPEGTIALVRDDSYNNLSNTIWKKFADNGPTEIPDWFYGGQSLKGDTGDAGLGIKTITLEGDNLVITLDDDSTQDLGSVKGPKGDKGCLLYTSPSPRDATLSRMPSSA